MSILVGNPFLLNAADTGYQVSRSLRFNSADSAYLSRTPASAGNRRTWTFSCWIKRAKLGEFTSIIVCMDSGASHYFQFVFETDDTLSVYDTNVAGSTKALQTSRVFRDVSAWYHLVLYYNTTQSTAANKAKLYVNGVEETAFSTDNRSSLTADSSMNRADQHSIGSRQPYSGSYLNAYLADIWFLDGIATDASSFAETNATTGQWIPKAYTGSKGTNGFHLEFADNSNNTASTLGKDTSGNGNNWTPNNLSVTAGAGNDSLVDTPTSYGTDTGAGGEVRGNYCTLNPLDNSSGMTLANGNLDGSDFGGGHKGTRATIKFPASGKWYYEGTVTTLGGACCIGAATNAAANPDINATGSYYILVNSSGNVQRYQSFASYTGFDTPTVGTILRVAYDADAQKLWLGLNGLWMNGSNGTTGNPATGANATFSSITDIYPAIDQQTSAVALNFGQRPFAYTAPSGFKALCDTNLPAPLVAKPNEVFDVVTYTGNGSARSITLPGGFSPDLIWTKARSAAYFHHLYDIIRGTNSDLCSNSTTNELTGSPYNDGVTAFNSNGYSLGTFNGLNENGTTYVGWAWDAGTTTTTNTAGSIQSSTRVNATSGCAVVTWTGTGANATIGHGGLANLSNGMIIIKNRSSATNWRVYHSALGNTKVIFLSTTGTPDTNSVYWNNTSPTSTVFSVGSDDGVNGNGNAMVAYCFAPVANYSSFGSYTGNGSTDGPFVYTGFKVKWLMIKRTDSTSNWYIIDASRSPYNEVNDLLYAEQSLAETVDDGNNGIDFLSNGFKLRKGVGGTNVNASTLIYAAFAENPFQYARAR